MIFIVTFSIYIILWLLHKFSNICKPEEGWYGQPKYCYEKTIHVVLNQLCSSLWTSRSWFIHTVVIMSHLRPLGFFSWSRGTRLNASHYNYHVRIKCTIQCHRIQTLRWGGEGWSSRPLDKRGGGGSHKKLFSTLRPLVWSKNKGGWTGPLSWIRQCNYLTFCAKCNT